MRLTGVSEILPGRPVTNAEMAARFGLHEQWIARMTGNRARYFCDPEAAGGLPRDTGDLATLAGARALEAAGVDPADLDFLVLATGSPDQLMPATVNVVADRLGVDGVPTLQLSSGCAGAIQALFTARALLASGLRLGLVIGADSVARLWPPGGPDGVMKPAELANFALFGDGAGAAVVAADDDGAGVIVDHVLLKTLGKGRPPAQVVRWYGASGAPMVTDRTGGQVRQPMAEEDYRAIAANVPRLAELALAELLDVTGHRLTDVDRVLVPQLNGVMSEKIRQHLGVRPDQDVACVAETGNSGNALPFIQLARALRGLGGEEPGTADRTVLVTTVESSKWIIGGLALRVPAAA